MRGSGLSTVIPGEPQAREGDPWSGEWGVERESGERMVVLAVRSTSWPSPDLIRGSVPAIHVLPPSLRLKDVDARPKAGHDGRSEDVDAPKVRLAVPCHCRACPAIHVFRRSGETWMPGPGRA